MRKVIKIIAIIGLLISIGYASNWDIPKETKDDWEREHWEALQVYEEAKEIRNEE